MMQRRPQKCGGGRRTIRNLNDGSAWSGSRRLRPLGSFLGLPDGPCGLQVRFSSSILAIASAFLVALTAGSHNSINKGLPFALGRLRLLLMPFLWAIHRRHIYIFTQCWFCPERYQFAQRSLRTIHPVFCPQQNPQKNSQNINNKTGTEQTE